MGRASQYVTRASQYVSSGSPSSTLFRDGRGITVCDEGESELDSSACPLRGDDISIDNNSSGRVHIGTNLLDREVTRVLDTAVEDTSLLEDRWRSADSTHKSTR